MTTLHLNVSEGLVESIYSFLDSLPKDGESVEIIDDKLYQYEKDGILRGLEQLKDGDVYLSDDVLKLLNED